jgi:hypothetical protein
MTRSDILPIAVYTNTIHVIWRVLIWLLNTLLRQSPVLNCTRSPNPSLSSKNRYRNI